MLWLNCRTLIIPVLVVCIQPGSQVYHTRSRTVHSSDCRGVSSDAVRRHNGFNQAMLAQTEPAGLQVTCSVIGRNCHIGKGVQIKGCYIGDYVTVQDAAQLTSAMVCEGAVIMRNAKLQPGSIVSFKVRFCLC